MIFFVGAMSSNPKDAPYGLWSLVGMTAFGAIVASKNSLHYTYITSLYDATFLCAVFVRPTLRRVGIDAKKTT